MIYESTKLVQIERPINPAIGLSTEAGREALAEQIKADIDEYCRKAYDDGPRSHLGASEIGSPCPRALWYKFRWTVQEPFDGRMHRLFNRGHKEEGRFIEWLRGIGAEIIQTDSDGKQMRMSAVGGHFGGSCDGRMVLARYGLGETFLVEMKTYSTKTFEKLKERGVKKSKPMHWSQMCVYGVGFNLYQGVYIAICKDTDEIWVEVLELDQELGRALLGRAHVIITATEPPPRLSNNPSFWDCKWCSANRICHMGDAPDMNCRSCKNASPIDNGEWQCAKFGVIPKEAIKEGCGHWESIVG